MPVRLVQRAYKTELDLNDRQVTACKQHAGAARWAYNWGLQVKQERYRTSTKESQCHRRCTGSLMPSRRRRSLGCISVSKCAPQEALWNLDGWDKTNTSSGDVRSRSKGRGRVSSGTPSSRPRRRGWAVSGSRAGSWCRIKAIVLPRLGRLQLKERGYLPIKQGSRSSRPR